MYGGYEGKVQKEEKRSKWQSYCAFTIIFNDSSTNYLATPTAEGKGEGTFSPFDLAVE
jgi:hypothetical protein